MKFFVSGQINDLENVRNVIDKVLEAGHELTHDWTASDTILGGPNSKLENIEESATRAKKDITGVIQSDVYVLCSDNENVGKGMYVELGAALALNETVGKPERVYIIGALSHLSIFYLHPAVKRRATIEEVIDEIKHVQQRGLDLVID